MAVPSPLRSGSEVKEGLRDGTARATIEHPLRSNAVHTITRVNTGPNIGHRLPIVHWEFVKDWDGLDVKCVPKGSGSENMSFLKMCVPADGVKGIKQFVLESIVGAGGKPCPPGIVGVGIGGTADYAMYLAKEAITRPVGTRNPDPLVAELEKWIGRGSRQNVIVRKEQPVLGVPQTHQAGSVPRQVHHLHLHPAKMKSLTVDEGPGPLGIDPAAELPAVAPHRHQTRELSLWCALAAQEGRIHRSAHFPGTLPHHLLPVGIVDPHRRAARLCQQLGVPAVIDVAVAHEKLRATGQVKSGGRRARPQRRLALGSADAGVEEGHPAGAILEGVGVDRSAGIDERDGHRQPVDAQRFEDGVAGHVT